MARTKITGTLKEQEHHIGNRPALIGTITVGDKEYDIAGWIHLQDDGSVNITLEDTLPKRPPKNSQ